MKEDLLRVKSKKSQGKRKASFAPTSAAKKPKKWSWTSKVVEILLMYILSTMYAEIRRCMALDFPEDFGHDIVEEPGKELTDINSEEYEFYQKSWKSRRGTSQIILIVFYLATVQLSPRRQIQ